jgi:hypothetical protein
METFYIEDGRSTPEILLRPEADLYHITGNSFPANPLRFYEPVLEWFSSFFASKNTPNELNIRLEFSYLNTASQKQIVRLLKLIAKNKNDKKTLIEWYYPVDDLDMLETGQRFQKICDLTFEYKKMN